MHKVTVYGGENRILLVEDGELLSKVLMGNRIEFEHPCGGRGVCNKCKVWVNGKKVLSCRYKIHEDITVEIYTNDVIATAEGYEEQGEATGNMCLCLDVGTTTMVLALVSLDEGKIVKTITRNNPQRAFAADVMSRIDYVAKNGVKELHEAVISEVNNMVDSLIDYSCSVDTLYVAGNTTMLHLFFGISCASMGYAPYEPQFIGSKVSEGRELGVNGVKKVEAIEGISAFVGADIVSGLGYVGEAEDGKYNILIDLGTNAEVVLYSKDKLYCTAAAAGPCFEGVNISSGMSAVEGAVYSVFDGKCLTIGNTEPRGICATGLIDAVSYMYDEKIIDETGYMESGEFFLTENVKITQKDVREFQLAKSAICAGIEALVKKAEIGYDSVGKAFIAGGFSSKMNFDNAFKVGLLPKDLEGKTISVNNSCLSGVIKYALEKTDYSVFLKNAQYVDLAMDEYFQDLFMENMMF